MFEAAVHQVLGRETPDGGVVDVHERQLGPRSQNIDDGKAALANRVGMLAADEAGDDSVALPVVEPVPGVAPEVVVVNEPRPVLSHVAADSRKDAAPGRPAR